jgi:hypothetical protein
MADSTDAPGTAIAEKIRDVGTDLAETLRRVIEAVPGRPHRPNHLARELGLNRAISSRVLSATAKKDPLEVTHIIPGPEPLRNLLRAASGKKVDPGLIARAEAAVVRFERLISTDAGTRSRLDAIISSSLPGAREKLELSSKYAVFKGMSQLMGVQAETWLTSMIYHPTAGDPMRLDVAPIHGAIGMQRLRPGVAVHFSFGKAPPSSSSADHRDAPIGSMPLDQFYANPPARLVAHQNADELVHTFAGDEVGPKAAVDMLAADHHEGAIERYAPPDAARKRGGAVLPDIPVKTLLFDMALYDDVFPGSDPVVHVYNAGLNGRPDVNDPKRDVDRMDVHESVEFLGRGVERFHASEVPNYVDMLRHVCGQLGWDGAAFRGYRCRVQYPVHGWVVCMSFLPPAQPNDGA